jgi:serine/threonine protein kinase
MTETIGRYEVLEKTGQGGFAEVYRAHDTQLDRLVALKELRPILLNDPHFGEKLFPGETPPAEMMRSTLETDTQPQSGTRIKVKIAVAQRKEASG